MTSCNKRDMLLDDNRLSAEAKRKFLAVLKDVRSKGLPLLVWEVYRSPAKQLKLFIKGLTRLRFPKWHGNGRAMDCCWLVDGKPTWNVPQEWWQTYGKAVRAHGLIWGGDWKTRDCPHAQWEGK
ncbi:MAG: M15 family metallopeptidase [bacterium]